MQADEVAVIEGDMEDVEVEVVVTVGDMEDVEVEVEEVSSVSDCLSSLSFDKYW